MLITVKPCYGVVGSEVYALGRFDRGRTRVDVSLSLLLFIRVEHKVEAGATFQVTGGSRLLKID